jgi:hypothetical protein
MNGRFQMQGGKNWILPKYIDATRFLWDSHWLEIWSNHFCPSMGLNGGSVATDSGVWTHTEQKKIAGRGDFQRWCNINVSKQNHTVKRQIEHLFDSAANK